MFSIKKNLLIASAASLLSVGIANSSPSLAATIDFSSNTWSKTGDVTPTTPSNVTLLTGTDSVTDAYSLETFLGLNSGGLSSDNFFGSATRFNNVKAGDSISFDWNFTQDGNDRAFVVINQNIQPLTVNSSTFQKTFDVDGYFSIGVIDVGGDAAGTSTLQVTNATYQAVPEPISILGSLTACGFGVVIRRRFGKKS